MVYRAAAADPAQTREAPQRARLVLDDLEELRLEVQALRKGLESTRARVKSLEAEVDTLKRQQRVTPMQGSGQGMPGGGILGFQGGGNFGSFNGGTGFSGGGGFAGGGSGFAGSGGSFVPSDAEIIRRYRDDLAKKANQLQRAKPKATPDPLADAEQAIKELRQHPGNKQATEQLERALQALKGGSKQKEEPKR